MHKFATIYFTLLLIGYSTSVFISSYCSSHIKKIDKSYKCAGGKNNDLLGKGGNGSAFLVTSLTDNQNYVFKVSEDRSNFLSKADDLHELVKDEPYVAKRYLRVVEEGIIYEVLELGENGSLLEAVEGNKLGFDEKKIMEIFGKIVEGVINIHKRNVVHADIKLENVVMTKDNEPRIIDFDVSMHKNSRGAAGGSSFYMAPEVVYKFRNPGTIVFTEKQDAWSLGMLLHLMMFKTIPHYPSGSPIVSGFILRPVDIFDKLLAFAQKGELHIPKGTSNEVVTVMSMLLKTKTQERASLTDVKAKIDEVLKLEKWSPRPAASVLEMHKKGENVSFGSWFDYDTFKSCLGYGAIGLIVGLVQLAVQKSKKKEEQDPNVELNEA